MAPLPADRRRDEPPKSADVIVVGGGIVGTAAAAFLGEEKLKVVLVEERTLAAGASGRNSGSLQHPFDPLLGVLHRRTLELYRELAALDERFALGDEPAGLLLLGHDGAELAHRGAAIAATVPELAPELLEPAAARAREPSVAAGLWALRLATGWPVEPAAATLAFARRARRAGADVLTGDAALLDMHAGRAVGVRLATGERIGSDRILVAAGPWSTGLLPEWADSPPITPVWGLVASTRLERPPAAILEEASIDAEGSAEPAMFSLVTAAGRSAVGSTFLAHLPDERPVAASVMRRAARFVPAVASASVDEIRVCARPVSRDGLPAAGPTLSDGVFVCAGHGPWGISIGPATARLVTDALLGRETRDDGPAVLERLDPARWQPARRDMQAVTTGRED